MQPQEVSKTRRGSAARLTPKKVRVTLPLDEEIVDWFRQQAGDANYQTAINDALLEHIIREELHRTA